MSRIDELIHGKVQELVDEVCKSELTTCPKKGNCAEDCPLGIFRVKFRKYMEAGDGR